MKRFTIEAVFKGTDKVSAPISRMENKIGKTTRRIQGHFNRVNRGINRVGRSLRNTVMIVGVFAVALIGAFTNVARAGVDYEQAIAGVGAVSLKSRGQIKALEAETRRLGRTTKFTATEAAKAMEILARSGFSEKSMLLATEPVLLAATASGDGMAETADNLVKVVKGMGLNLEGTVQGGRVVRDIGIETMRVADVMAKASSVTNSTIGSIGEGMSKVAFKAKSLQIPLEEIVASVALMQDIGIDPSISGTAIKTMLSKMAVPTPEIQAGMNMMGLSFKDDKGNFKTLPKLLGEINKATSKMQGNFDKTAFLVDLVGMRGQIAAEGLADLYETGRLSNLTAELDSAGGTAAAMAKLRMDNIGGDLVILNSAIESVKISILQTVDGPLRVLIHRLTAWINKNEELIAQNIGKYLAMFFNYLNDNGAKILQQVEGLWKFVKVLAVIIIVFKVVTAVGMIMNLMLISPWAIVIGLVVAFLGWMYLLILQAGGFKQVWKNVLDWFKGAWEYVTDFVGLMWDQLTAKIMEVVGTVRKAVRAIVEGYRTIKGGGFMDTLGNLGSLPGAAASYFGGGGEGRPGFYTVASPQDRMAAVIAEQKMTAELTLRNYTGLELAGTGTPDPGRLNIINSGGFPK